MKSTNTKGFTLVELIIVITILAILATIAFISFQGYTKEARDASKQSEIANIVKVMSANEAKNSITILSYIEASSTGTVDNIKGSSGIVYTGTLNQTALALKSDYVYEVAMADGLGTYTIRAAADNTEENGPYIKNGTYNARINVSASGTITDKVVTLTNNFGLFKLGDVVAGTSGTGKITSISPDLKKLTLDTGSATGTTFSLNGLSETTDLFTAQ